MRARGVALVAVLWIVALLALLAVSALKLAQSQRRGVERIHGDLDETNLRDATLLEVARNLGASNPALRRRVPGGPTVATILDRTVQIALEGESGRVDLNTADDALLTALLVSQGASERDAEDFLAKLRDWQDTDNIRRPGGAEAVDYRLDGLAYEPRNAPLQSVDEAFEIPGADRVRLKCLRAALTVYSGASTANPRYAGPLVDATLRWAAQREWAGKTWAIVESRTSAASEESHIGEVLRLHLGTAMPSEAVTEIVFRLTGDERAPTLVYRIEPSTSSTPDCAPAQ